MCWYRYHDSNVEQSREVATPPNNLPSSNTENLGEIIQRAEAPYVRVNNRDIFLQSDKLFSTSITHVSYFNFTHLRPYMSVRGPVKVPNIALDAKLVT